MTNSTSGALIAERRDANSLHFWWEGSSVRVHLPTHSPIHTISVQECAVSDSMKFKFPHYAQLCSKVYELSCTCAPQPDGGKAKDTVTTAVVTVPISKPAQSGHEFRFFLAPRTPSHWRCDLTPGYTFYSVSGNVGFDAEQSLARLTVPEFDCFICVLLCPTT